MIPLLLSKKGLALKISALLSVTILLTACSPIDKINNRYHKKDTEPVLTTPVKDWLYEDQGITFSRIKKISNSDLKSNRINCFGVLTAMDMAYMNLNAAPSNVRDGLHKYFTLDSKDKSKCKKSNIIDFTELLKTKVKFSELFIANAILSEETGFEKGETSRMLKLELEIDKKTNKLFKHSFYSIPVSINTQTNKPVVLATKIPTFKPVTITRNQADNKPNRADCVLFKNNLLRDGKSYEDYIRSFHNEFNPCLGL